MGVLKPKVQASISLYGRRQQTTVTAPASFCSPASHRGTQAAAVRGRGEGRRLSCFGWTPEVDGGEAQRQEGKHRKGEEKKKIPRRREEENRALQKGGRWEGHVLLTWPLLR